MNRKDIISYLFECTPQLFSINNSTQNGVWLRIKDRKFPWMDEIEFSPINKKNITVHSSYLYR